MPLIPEILFQNEYFHGKQKQRQKTKQKTKNTQKQEKQVRNSISY